MFIKTHFVTGLTAIALACGLAACSSMPQLDMARIKSIELPGLKPKPSTEPLAPLGERNEVISAVTDDNVLVHFNAGTPGQIAGSVPISGLKAGEQILAMDYRVAKGQLYALSSAGRLLRIDIDTGAISPIGEGIALSPGADPDPGFDFNPTVDRIRVVDGEGLNLRLHPDTGARIDGDPKREGMQPDGTLLYRPGDLLSGSKPRIVASAYTYNRTNEKITTNYVIDAGTGYLAVQGSTENAASAISPNSGLLQAVGPLTIERFDHAAFDIADPGNAAFLATTRQGSSGSRLHEVDLGSGQARLIGTIGTGRPVRAIAIEP